MQPCQQAAKECSAAVAGDAQVVGTANVGNSIVLACDEAYAMPLATTIRSLVEADQSKRCIDLVVLSSEFSNETKKKVSESLPKGSVSIRWVDADLAPYGNFSTPPYVSKMTYARLLIPHIVPENVTRVLYLDADLLVLRDLAPLWEMNLAGAALGAVVDIDSPIHVQRMHLDRDVDAARQEPRIVSPGNQYFNAGVLLIDVLRWREQHVSERAMEYLVRHPQTALADQDALNAACVGQWTSLDVQWNYQNHYKTRLAAIPPNQRPAIVHFITRHKPWNPRMLSVNSTFYDSFRSRTCFSRSWTEVLSDLFVCNWFRLRRSLRGYRAARLVWNIVQGDVPTVAGRESPG